MESSNTTAEGFVNEPLCEAIHSVLGLEATPHCLLTMLLSQEILMDVAPGETRIRVYARVPDGRDLGSFHHTTGFHLPREAATLNADAIELHGSHGEVVVLGKPDIDHLADLLAEVEKGPGATRHDLRRNPLEMEAGNEISVASPEPSPSPVLCAALTRAFAFEPSVGNLYLFDLMPTSQERVLTVGFVLKQSMDEQAIDDLCERVAEKCEETLEADRRLDFLPLDDSSLVQAVSEVGFALGGKAGT